MAAWFADLRNRSVLARAILLGLIVLGLYGLAAPVAWYLGGVASLRTAAVAAAVCLAGAVAALAFSSLLREPSRALLGMLLGMAARTGIPLGFGLACHVQGGALAETGLLYYLLVFYPVTLGVESAMSLPCGQNSSSRVS